MYDCAREAVDSHEFRHRRPSSSRNTEKSVTCPDYPDIVPTPRVLLARAGGDRGTGGHSGLRGCERRQRRRSLRNRYCGGGVRRGSRRWRHRRWHWCQSSGRGWGWTGRPWGRGIRRGGLDLGDHLLLAHAQGHSHQEGQGDEGRSDKPAEKRAQSPGSPASSLPIFRNHPTSTVQIALLLAPLSGSARQRQSPISLAPPTAPIRPGPRPAVQRALQRR
jgi:hypothetical protein